MALATTAKDGLTRDERSLVRDAMSCYARGWFPMLDPDTGVVHWVQPRRRGLIPLEEDAFRVGRSLRSLVKSGRFRITSNVAFEQVIRECAAPGPGQRSETWLSPDIIDLFELMHRGGHAHSVEAWIDGPDGPDLVGGLYGLAVGSVFCGESMFFRAERGGSNASKVCLVHLVGHLRMQGFTMLDAQLNNAHLAQFGCFEIDQSEYAERLYVAAAQHRDWGIFGLGRVRGGAAAGQCTHAAGRKPLVTLPGLRRQQPCTAKQSPRH